MSHAPLPVQPLEYRRADETSWAPIVRVCAYLAAAEGMLLLVAAISQFVELFAARPTSWTWSSWNVTGMTAEGLLGLAAGAMTVATLMAARLARQTDRRLIIAAAGLIIGLTVRDSLRLWGIFWAISAFSPPSFISVTISTVAGYGV